MKYKNKYIFLTGVPGSRWGRLERMLYNACPGLIDMSSNISYLQDMPTHGTQHIYTFWGPYHQHGDGFDRLDLLGPEEVMRQIESAYDPDQEGWRIIRCHWFSYQLDWIVENLPDVDIMLVFREPEMSYRWWHESGGWDINYPNYAWFGTDENLKREIMTQTKLMHKFVKEKNLKIDYNLAQAEEWIKKYLPSIQPKEIVKNPLDETLWPVYYRGLGE